MIVIFVRDLTGGIRKHVVSLLNQYMNKPDDVVLVTNLSCADLGFQTFLKEHPIFKNRIFDVSIVRQPHIIDVYHVFLILKKLRGLSRRWVFHGHGAKGGMLARVLGGLLGHPVVYTPHGGSVHRMHGRVTNCIYSWLERGLYYLTDYIVFESLYSMATYSHFVKSKTSKFILNYNGVSFENTVHTGSAVQKKNGDLFVLGAFGSLRHIKGYDVLLRAAARLINGGHKIRVDIYGDGECKDELFDLASQLKIGGAVRLGLVTDDALTAMKECDLVIQPSRFESFGYSTLEAISVGVPVIVSEVGGLIEIVENKVTGLTVPPDDTVALAKAILFMKENPSERQQMAQAAYTTASQKFSESTMLVGIDQVYSKARDTYTRP